MVESPNDRGARVAFKPAPKIVRAKKKTDFFSILIGGLVIGVLIVALFISASAIIEKIRLAQGLRSMIELVDTARELAASNQSIGQQSLDLVAMLEKLGRDTPTGISGDLKTLTNPWEGLLMAVIVPPGHIRIETVVPPHACRRMIELFGQDAQALGVEDITVRGPKNSGRQIYSRATPGPIGEAAMIAGCGNDPLADLILTFSLR